MDEDDDHLTTMDRIYGIGLDWINDKLSSDQALLRVRGVLAEELAAALEEGITQIPIETGTCKRCGAEVPGRVLCDDCCTWFGAAHGVPEPAPRDIVATIDWTRDCGVPVHELITSDRGGFLVQHGRCGAVPVAGGPPWAARRGRLAEDAMQLLVDMSKRADELGGGASGGPSAGQITVAAMLGAMRLELGELCVAVRDPKDDGVQVTAQRGSDTVSLFTYPKDVDLTPDEARELGMALLQGAAMAEVQANRGGGES